MKAVVLLSGGLDSTTLLAKALDEDRHVYALSVFYGQRHEIELDAAEKITDFYRVSHKIHEMNIPAGGLLTGTGKDREMVHKSYSEIEGVSPTFVPNRNAQLLSLAAAVAQSGGMDEVWFAAHADDAANWAYPDCTPEFVGAMAAAIYIASYHKVRLVAPFIHMTKADIVKAGHNLRVPYDMTRSCYEAAEIHCGQCPTCISRIEAFRDAGVYDPTTYKAGIHAGA